ERPESASFHEISDLRGEWCPGKESNLHTLRYTDLNRARLPIPPPGHCESHLSGRVRRVNAENRVCTKSCRPSIDVEDFLRRHGRIGVQPIDDWNAGGEFELDDLFRREPV